MASRRNFLQNGLGLAALGVISVPLVGCATRVPLNDTSATLAGAAPRLPAAPQAALVSAVPARPAASAGNAPSRIVQSSSPISELAPPPDIFDAQALLDQDFWLRPRVLEVTRPASRERAKLLYWKDGVVIDSAYQDLCHLLRDVNGKETAKIDPKLLETLWGTQAFVARYGIDEPLEILSGYRTPASNAKLREAGIPAARQSLHMVGKAADIRVSSLTPDVLGGLVRSFRQGGVGFYYRNSARGGWIHADTGLKRTWKG
ncbi:YcbK family protein [Janthinobacterium agaricidamnosum]|uniref:Murein endopeptidase K n=1 Tax=Janthinobacterium agaricidamnosum NBRC 102515 = DSM 9628 TaxID=1349767 RepID=W0V5A5_9BURK|nr:DUF882 domain-containing protein [Janthinobacterium agaricidamnosum]CDG82528.1 peptidase M15 family protein [Janthinobacterium agaricidamnosum NBRC 102515 = DSM 9628]